MLTKIFTQKAVSLRIDCFFLIKISDWSDEMSDIFKDMQVNVGCVHIPQELRIRSRGTERHSASN